MITLSESEMTDLLNSAREDLVRTIILEKGQAITLLTPSQAAGILDVRVETLARFPIPRVAIDSRMIRYRLSDISAFIESKIER